MDLTATVLKNLATKYSDAFYLLDSKQFRKNLDELIAAFRAVYPKFNIAYSYKTNYIPALAKIVNECGGYAEVVSDMETEVALKIGVSPEKIILNGPCKNLSKSKELLLGGGIFNVDSAYELPFLRKLSEDYPQRLFRIGLRVNFAINDGVISRFGLPVESVELRDALELINHRENMQLTELQLHYASRSLATWTPRVKGMLELIRAYDLQPEQVDLGGGLYGKMPPSLQEQFSQAIPTYTEYANASARIFAEYYHQVPEEKRPLLLLEPGTALVGDCMSFAAKVINIKEVRGKSIATLLGSVYNINPTLNGKNPPLHVYPMGNRQKGYMDLDFGGFTCIESDYLYRHYNGALAVGDFVVFDNVGSYSITLKPPFILPNFPIIDITGEEIRLVKRQETFDDLFQTYVF